jgi:hypothetical protein
MHSVVIALVFAALITFSLSDNDIPQALVIPASEYLYVLKLNPMELIAYSNLKYPTVKATMDHGAPSISELERQNKMSGYWYQQRVPNQWSSYQIMVVRHLSSLQSRRTAQFREATYSTRRRLQVGMMSAHTGLTRTELVLRRI